MHEVLEELLARLGEPGHAESLPRRARPILDGCSPSSRRWSPPAGRSGVRAAALRAIEADLRRYLAHEARDGCDWEPAGLELRFGFADEEDSLPALELGSGRDGPGARRDRPRRRRPERQRAIVRDYKSGAARPE